MLSLPQIQMMVGTGSFERLVERVLSNGRADHWALRMRLTRPGALGPAALGLALQRVCELSYGPTPLSASLAARLIHLQREDGCFAGDDTEAPFAMGDDEADGGDATDPHAAQCDLAEAEEPTPEEAWASLPATAVALRALIDHRRQREEAGSTADPALDAVIARALHGIATSQHEDGLIGEDAVEAAIILWQLGASNDFRRLVRYHDLVDAVNAEAPGVVADELLRLVHVMAA